ncbi:biotin--[acetyl-CoA-carboxylase] ligase [Natronorarus salvus]|uniref:biotin--[acetyl-CoA-carboxylase] ligase n=1 Tax=Natronorarus salvus TaxID=3117733 RepID=UPI002F2624B3
MEETRRALLDALREGPVSGPEFAGERGVSRAAVWNHVEALREEGFEIDSEEGYRLRSTPEFGAGAIVLELETASDVEFHDSIPSTNARARELAREGASEVLVVADEQTGGRGRLDRAWSSPSGGIYASVLLRPELPPARVPLLTLAGAVAVAETARTLGVDAGIKWPNDVLVGSSERKLSGIRTEMEGEADRVTWVVVGIGLNANVGSEALPEGATSLREEVGPVVRRTVLAAVIDRFDELRRDPDAILDAWRERALTLGREVRVETRTEVIVGRAVDVEGPGTLVVEIEGGPRRVHAGDCEHLRPTD